MKSVPLTAYTRTATRRAGAKKLRESGRVPAVIYGVHAKPQTLEITSVDLDNLLHHARSENILLDLAVSGDDRAQRMALVQEIQHHPLTGKVIHMDLREVVGNQKVSVMVPVEPVGEAVGAKSGGILETVRFKLKVAGLPKDLPEVLQVDVAALDIGKSIHIGDIKAPEGCEILGDKHISVFAMAAPVTEEEEKAAAAAAEGSVAEVEMIKEKKEDGEGDAKAAPAKGAAPAADKAAPAADKKPAAKK